MKVFKPFNFLADLQDLIQESNSSDVWDIVHQEVDAACIYYNDCFAIVCALGMTDWEDNEFGNITNITQLAYVSLYEYVCDNLEVPA